MPRLPATSAPSPSEGASPEKAWSHFYEGRLGWNAHLKNIGHHLPYLWHVMGHQPASILEVGSGSGSMSTSLSYLRRRIASVDISPGIIAQCRRDMPRLFGRARYVLGDAFNLSALGFERFSITVSQGLMEHFDDGEIGRLVQEQLRVAERVSFSVPNAAYGRLDFGDERLPSKSGGASSGAWGYRLSLAADYRPYHWDRRALAHALPHAACDDDVLH